MDSKIKAILFDSGRVLNRPLTGHWFIPPNFFKYVDKRIFTSLSKIKVKIAFSRAFEYISKQYLILNEDEEYKHFIEYYKILFAFLPELNASNEMVENVAHDLVYNYDKYSFYSDVREIIPVLSSTYKLGIVSDAWPSLENVFSRAGIRDYFSSFIISSKLGTTKPNKLMYESALEELNVSPQEAVFIDDSTKNCNGARAIGIKTLLMSRDLSGYIYNKLKPQYNPVIRNLKTIEYFINRN